MDTISKNLEDIKHRIKRAAEVSGRNENDILLLGVTKTVDIDRIKTLMDCGIKNLGENRVQELTEKYEIIGDEARWHLIGHLQTNKVKYIVNKVKLIHSVESLRLAEEIDRQARKHDKVMDILVEVNVSGEESKFGVKPNEVYDFIQKASSFDGIRIRGLMTVAPFVENPQENRVYFEQMYKLFIDMKHKNNDNINMTYLSMGMTNDYEVAIEEGSNIVRIGTGIFGARNYN